jgi:heat shock protein HslJ
MKASMIVAALAVGAACAPATPVRNDTIAWPDTTDTEWVAASIGGSPLVPGTRVTMRTSPRGIGGYSGCNWYGLRNDSGRTLVEMTARGCRSDIQDQERRLTVLLPQAVRGVRRGDTLVLLDRVPSELITFVRRHPTPSEPSQLVGTAWRLAWSTSRFVDIDSVWVRFGTESVSGFGGCRAFDGTYNAQSDRLRFTRIAMRALECASERARVAEEHLTTVFSETEHFAIRADTLLLTTFGGDTLRLRRLE